MRYVRFLKPPRIATDKGSSKTHVTCLITLTSDLGDSFFPHHVELAAELLSRDGICVWRTVQWTAGLRSLAISLPLKKSYASSPLRVRVGVEPNAQSDALHELAHADAHGIVSAWSAEFNTPGSPEAAKLVQRRFTIGHKVVSVWEETGESIARHLWDAGITLAHHLSSPTAALSTALLPALPRAPLNVLELGTGCGIVGIALASLLPQCTVTLTDLPEAQDIVSANLSLCHSTATLAPGSRISFAELDWAAALPPWLTQSDAGELHLVVAADCTYNPDSSPALVRTLTALSALSPAATVAIATKQRHDSERVFFPLMADAGFVSTAVLPYDVPGDQRAGEERVDVHIYRTKGWDV